MENQTTTVTYFLLLGFSYNPPLQIFLFLLLSFIYVITLLGNIIIMMVIRGNSHLHSPMYFFLSHLAFLDICFSSVTVPKLLVVFSISKAISYNGCITQMFFIIMTASTEAYVLAAMAYDRYAAICKPLHYVQIINQAFCKGLVCGAWIISFMYAMANTMPVLKLTFCGPNIIRHVSCEFPSLLALSCSDTFPNQMVLFISGGTVGMSSFFIILLSYLRIISTILNMHSAEARRKTFSTCSSHLIIVTLYYSTGLFRYMKPKTASSVLLDTILSMQYNIATPILNPIIYSLKTREMKEAIKRLMGYKPLISHTM